MPLRRVGGRQRQRAGHVDAQACDQAGRIEGGHRQLRLRFFPALAGNYESVMLCAAYQDNGVTIHESSEFRDKPAFDLTIDGESLYFGWEYVGFSRRRIVPYRLPNPSRIGIFSFHHLQKAHNCWHWPAFVKAPLRDILGRNAPSPHCPNYYCKHGQHADI